MSSAEAEYLPVFISYASDDRDRVLPIVDELLAAGVPIWVDRYGIPGGSRWAAEIVSAIDSSKILVLMCSQASIKSWAVKQEIQIAAENQKILLPLLLERTDFTGTVRFFLAGWQWLEVLDHSLGKVVPEILSALRNLAVKDGHFGQEVAGGLQNNRLLWTFEGLRGLAAFTDQIWPAKAEGRSASTQDGHKRGLGARVELSRHRFSAGEEIQLVVESERYSHILLIDEGPDKQMYCLCPSLFAPNTEVRPGVNVFPQVASPFPSFRITGGIGREHLVAVLSDEPIAVGWASLDDATPAKVLMPSDLSQLMDLLRRLKADSWVALSTYFDIVP